MRSAGDEPDEPSPYRGLREPSHLVKTPPPKSPFAALATLRDALPVGPEPGARAEPAASASVNPFAAKVVVSRSRKGRGGRTVTVVAGLRGGEAVLDGLCRDLKRALGCGASVEGETIVVSGELVERVKKWLEDSGATKVIVGN